MKTYRVSVIVPVFNMDRYLAQTLDSLKKQSLKGLEVIIVDDTSTDSTPAIIDSFCKANRNFTSITLPGVGLAASRNAGLKAAQGKYVTFLDGDDIYTPTFLKSMADTADKYAAQMTVGRMRSFDIFGMDIFISADELSLRKLTDRFDTDLIWNPALSNKLFLRSQTEKLGLLLPECGVAQEAAFSLSFALKSDKIACCKRGYTQHRNRGLDAKVKEGIGDLKDYLAGYEMVLAAARESFENAINSAQTDFDRSELKRQEGNYVDEVLSKELTVILYRYYRRFHKLKEEDIACVAEEIEKLRAGLTKRAEKKLLDIHKDIFIDGKLKTSKAEMARHPLVCVAVCADVNAEKLAVMAESIFGQSLPAFELLADAKLMALFPQNWLENKCVKFIDAPGIAEFKQAALEMTQAKYILFLEIYALLDSKLLQRHYNALESHAESGFSASPVSRFDGKHAHEYKSSTLAFYSCETASKADNSPPFVLDLFFCNKVFRVSHLKGIKFLFSGNRILDIYRLYKNSTFYKLLKRGVYLDLTEDALLQMYLHDKQSLLPEECADYYKHWKKTYFRMVTLKKQLADIKTGLSRLKRFTLDNLNIAAQDLFRYLPMHNRVLFYSIRAQGKLLENSRCVYDALDTKKKALAYTLPHSFFVQLKMRYYLLTNKVIVTDDYVRYLRMFRLREGQKVVQLWHACGAFKRFGLDAPSRLTNYEEQRTHSQYSAVCVSSEQCRQYYAHAFGIPLNTVLPIGVPRTDALVSEESRAKLRENLLRKHPILTGKKVILFCPTFREENGKRIDYDPQIDWKALNDELAEDEFFIIHKHPVMQEKYIKGKIFDRLRDYSAEPTPELIAAADLVITDYSSVIFDTAILLKPMLFYCPDFDSYDRDFYLRYPEDLPGPVVYSPDKLLGAIREVIADPPTEKIEAFLRSQMGACDGKATERVVELIKGYLKD
jgi:CDP-glycerol glycerophosphotransferase (TagB/SpsB family)/glycosyltransferase involved in cell wall biosynthesis